MSGRLAVGDVDQLDVLATTAETSAAPAGIDATTPTNGKGVQT